MSPTGLPGARLYSSPAQFSGKLYLPGQQQCSTAMCSLHARRHRTQLYSCSVSWSRQEKDYWSRTCKYVHIRFICVKICIVRPQGQEHTRCINFWLHAYMQSCNWILFQLMEIYYYYYYIRKPATFTFSNTDVCCMSQPKLIKKIPHTGDTNSLDRCG